MDLHSEKTQKTTMEPQRGAPPTTGRTSRSSVTHPTKTSHNGRKQDSKSI